MKKIYIFGNSLLEFDNTPIKLKPELEKAFPDIEFIILDPTENLKPENKELTIIDTVEGINEIRMLNDIDKIEVKPRYSLHDYDLGFSLKLLKKIGELEKVTIFCVPMKIKKQVALEHLVELMSKTIKPN